jgi:hypothetical protein
MRSRDFVTFVARAAAVWPGIALAQQSAGKVCVSHTSTQASAARPRRSTQP